MRIARRPRGCKSTVQRYRHEEKKRTLQGLMSFTRAKADDDMRPLGVKDLNSPRYYREEEIYSALISKHTARRYATARRMIGPFLIL